MAADEEKLTIAWNLFQSGDLPAAREHLLRPHPGRTLVYPGVVLARLGQPASGKHHGIPW